MNADDPVIPGQERVGTPREQRGGGGLMTDFVMALRFFSRLPSGSTPHEKPDLDRIAMALPLASVVIGAGPALLLIGAVLIGLPAYFAAALAVAAAVIAGGAMAEDAIADAADGLFGGQTRERRLEIMKDSRHGTYGVSALCLFLLLRVTALGSIAAAQPLVAATIWLGAGVVGRSGALWLPLVLPAARSDGASAAAGQVSRRGFAVGAALATVLVFLLAAPATNVVALVVAALLCVVVVAAWAALCRRLVDGQTGDLIGALMALLEITVLGTLVLFA